MDSREWVERERLDEYGYPVPMKHELHLHTGDLSREAHWTRTIGRDIGRLATRWGSPGDLLTKLAGTQTGVWYYIGWIDQAILHIGTVVDGAVDLLPAMVHQFDEDPVDQGGDMIVGFAGANREWVLEIRASRDDGEVTIDLRTNFAHHLAMARAALGLPEA